MGKELLCSGPFYPFSARNRILKLLIILTFSTFYLWRKDSLPIMFKVLVLHTVSGLVDQYIFP